MTARAYEVTVISAAGRETRRIIAHSSIQASRDGLNMIKQADASFLLVCKPLKLEAQS
jgi:hypothetical protein